MTVYAIQGEPATPIKIGYSATPGGALTRMAQMQTGYPWKLRMLFCMEGATCASHAQLGKRRPAGMRPKSLKRMVGAAGIEPATPTMSTEWPVKSGNDFNGRRSQHASGRPERSWKRAQVAHGSPRHTKGAASPHGQRRPLW